MDDLAARDDYWPDSHEPLRARWDPLESGEPRVRAPRPDRKTQSLLGRFISTYGWRAYALPVLLVITVLVVTDAMRGAPAPEPAAKPSDAAPGTPNHNPSGTGVIGAPPKGDGQFAAGLPTGMLPDGGAFTVDGPGKWHVVPGTTKQFGKGAQQTFTYTIEIEDGLDTSGVGGDQAVASMIDQTLANPKSWTKDDRFAFRRIDPAAKSPATPGFRISLTTQMSTRKACGFDIPIDSSCYNQGMGRVVLDVARWVRGALPFDGDIGSYRQYQINHEVGHAIGYPQHRPCESDGGLAPIMMQQTFGTANNDIAKLDPAGVVPMDGKKCRFNAWPFPRG